MNLSTVGATIQRETSGTTEMVRYFVFPMPFCELITSLQLDSTWAYIGANKVQKMTRRQLRKRAMGRNINVEQSDGANPVMPKEYIRFKREFFQVRQHQNQVLQ